MYFGVRPAVEKFKKYKKGDTIRLNLDQVPKERLVHGVPDPVRLTEADDDCIGMGVKTWKIADIKISNEGDITLVDPDSNDIKARMEYTAISKAHDLERRSPNYGCSKWGRSGRCVKYRNHRLFVDQDRYREGD